MLRKERWTSKGNSAAVDIRSSGAAVFQPNHCHKTLTRKEYESIP